LLGFAFFVFGADAFLNPASKVDILLVRNGPHICRRPSMASLSRFSARLIPPPPPPRGPPRPEIPADARKPAAPKKSEGIASRRTESQRENNLVSIDDVMVKSGSGQTLPPTKKYFSNPKSSFRGAGDSRSYRSSSKKDRQDSSPPPMLSRSEWLKAATIGGACE
jgi:hypothetical protein